MTSEQSFHPRIRIEKRNEKELIFYLEERDLHSLPNMISKLALQKPHVVYAAYTIDHPLISFPRISIVTDGERDPVEVLIEVLREAKEYAIKLKKVFGEILIE